MSSPLKPLTLWGHKTGPNSWKVALILSELNVPYEHKFLELAEMKEEAYESLNPNGRVPTVEDPNFGGRVVWESGACIDYVLETYDKEHKLLPKDETTKWTARSWRDFQMSGKFDRYVPSPKSTSLLAFPTDLIYIRIGQGPYFGQYSFFINYHPEKLPSVISRYENEILRIVGVMDKQLSKTTYLAGEAMTYVDLMWLPYFIVAFRVPDVKWEERFPSWGRWWRGLQGREKVEGVWGEWMGLRRSVIGR
ncbi:hypothetical protein M409DRAFT_28960 [Zasmidium cellare ATCC 36951]|uniref:Glutathione S-transferase n=1 Tax=Zasmidium cellare ATCC 36951 TaxID=1080233 RepID=A0A6A6C0S2_ZASCE|nr:uncharacterized protein M409DRAFT_28960 [Zasmidium cellare ATCC 36951]KAF2160575.1 hypothetical protein M409DRAFT_28960 [Zasmidium cellare ATCC 36951]